MPLKTRSWKKRCCDFISHAPGISNKTDLISEEHTCWAQAVMKRKSCVNKTGVSAHMQSDQKAGLYCYGPYFFRAGIQTAPPSWGFCSPYQQPTPPDPALGNRL